MSLTNLRATSQQILGPGTPDMSGRGIAVNDEKVRAVTPAGRRGTEEEIAAAACFLASDGASYITGHALVVDGGMSTTRSAGWPRREPRYPAGVFPRTAGAPPPMVFSLFLPSYMW